MAGSDHYFHTWCLYVRPSFQKQYKFQVRRVIANIGSVSLAEGIIDDIFVVMPLNTFNNMITNLFSSTLSLSPAESQNFGSGISLRELNSANSDGDLLRVSSALSLWISGSSTVALTNAGSFRDFGKELYIPRSSCAERDGLLGEERLFFQRKIATCSSNTFNIAQSHAL